MREAAMDIPAVPKDDRLLSDVKGSRSQPMAIPTPKKLVYFFERTKEPGETSPTQPRGMSPPRAEVSQAELIGNGNNGGSHGPILMSALRPCLTRFRVDPDRECHSLPARQHSLPVRVYVPAHFRL